MELLKKITLIISLMVSGNGLFSQANQAVLQAAFSKSYENEKNGDFIASMEPLKKVYDESSYELNLRLGWLNYNAGLFDQSVIFYSRAQVLKPYAEESRFGLIMPLAALGKWTDVIRIYNAILEVNPNNSVALYRLGLVYFGRKDYYKANALFNKVVDLYPFGYDGLLMLGWTSFYLGNTNQAKVLFNKVNLFSPGDKSANEGLNLIK